MFQENQKNIDNYFSNFTRVDIIYVIVSLTLLISAVIYTLITLESIPMVFRLVFYMWIAFTIFKSNYFLPFISSLFILDFYSIVPLQILPAEHIYSAIIIFISLLLNMKRFKENYGIIKPYFSISAIFLIYALSITLFNIGESTKFILVVFIFILLLIYIPTEKKHVMIFYFSFIIASLLLTYQGMVQQNLNVDLEMANEEGSRLMWVDPNYLSLLIDMGILLTLNLIFVVKEKMTRILLLLVFIFQCYILFLLASRGGILACVLILLYLVNKQFTFSRIIYFIITIFIAIILLNQFGFFDLFLERLQDDNLSTAGERTIIWSDLINELEQRNFVELLFGSGSTSSWHISTSIGAITSPHNNYLEILVDYGIIGFLMFFSSLSMLFVKSNNSLSRSVILLVLIGALTLSPFNYYIPWLFILFAIAYNNFQQSVSIELNK
ncbi:MAG: O-antigen ligase family protein [Bacteroidia bacterium]